MARLAKERVMVAPRALGRGSRMARCLIALLGLAVLVGGVGLAPAAAAASGSPGASPSRPVAGDVICEATTAGGGDEHQDAVDLPAEAVDQPAAAANTYRYVNGNPINTSDPSGHRPVCLGEGTCTFKPTRSGTGTTKGIRGTSSSRGGNSFGSFYSGLTKKQPNRGHEPLLAGLSATSGTSQPALGSRARGGGGDALANSLAWVKHNGPALVDAAVGVTEAILGAGTFAYGMSMIPCAAAGVATSATGVGALVGGACAAVGVAAGYAGVLMMADGADRASRADFERPPKNGTGGAGADDAADAVPETLKFGSRAAAREGLPGELANVGNRFFRGATSKSQDFQAIGLPGGGYRLQFFSPANNPGYGKLYVQEIDQSGSILRRYKDTMGPDGFIQRKMVH